MMASRSPAEPLTPRLRGLRDDLQPALQRIADLILASPERVAGMTITELAREAECSEATVVRFAREVGHRGYRDLRVQIHREAWADQHRPPLSGESGDIDRDDDLATITQKIANADARAVHDTVRGLDLAVLGRAAEQVVSAGRVMVFGVGASGLAAMDTQQKLFRIGLPAIVHTEAHSGLSAAGLLDAGDLALVLSHSGRTVEAVEVARVAHDSGARVIAITGSVASPLAREADEALLATAVEAPFRSGATASRIAQLTVIDCLFVAAATLLPDLGQEALRRTRTAVERRRLG